MANKNPEVITQKETSPEYLVAQLVYSDWITVNYVPQNSYKIKFDVKWGDIKDDISKQTDLYNILTKMQDDIAAAVGADGIFSYGGQVLNVEDLPSTAKVGVVYDVKSTGANYVFNGTDWDKLSENIDLSGYLTQEAYQQAQQAIYKKIEDKDTELEAEIQALDTAITNRYNHLSQEMAQGDSLLANLIDNNVQTLQGVDTQLRNDITTLQQSIANVFSKTEVQNLINGLQQNIDGKVDKQIDGTAGRALIFNESDGGGAKFEGKNGQNSFAGVNDMTDSNGVGVQLYNINTKDDNKGPRVNLTKDRATYSKDVTIVDEAHEIAIKQDLTDLSTNINQQINHVNEKLTQDIEKVAQDLADHIADAETGYVTNAQLQEEQQARSDADDVLNDRLAQLEDKDFVEYTDISNQDNPNRKAIVFKNHDGVFGKDTQGNTRNLAMISKYNVADFGTNHLHTNLNTQQIVTVNDTQAVVTDKNVDQLILEGDKIIIDQNTVTDPTTGFQFNTLTINADLKDIETDIESITQDVDNLVQDKVSVKDFEDEKAEREQAEQNLQDQIDGIGNTYATIQSVEDETQARQQADSVLQEHIDTKAEQTDLEAEITARQQGDAKIISKIWSNSDLDKGHFYSKITNNDGSYALTFNESDGGGVQYFNKTNNTIQFVGVNDGNDGILVQLYAKDKTTNQGARLNVTTQGIYYTLTTNGQYTAKDEVVVKRDLDTINTQIEEALQVIDTKLEHIFHYKGSVASTQDLPTQNNEIGDVYNVETDGHNVAWNGTSWDKLSETIDLTPYLTIESFNTFIANYYTKAEVDQKDQAIKDDIYGRIWSNKNNPAAGHLYTKMTNSQGGYALIFNENDGGGSQVYDKTDDVISYVGTNLEEGNGAENGVNVQIYSKNKTTNEGVRINVNTQKAYYLKGANVPNPATREIAVKEDVTQIQTSLDTLNDTVTDTLATQDGNIQALLLKMEQMEQKILSVRSLDPEVVVFYDGSDTDYENQEKDFQLSGTLTTTTNIKGNTITLKEATMDAANAYFVAASDVTIQDTTATGVIPLKIAESLIDVKADGYVAVRDCTFDPENAYRCMQFGERLGLAKSITIENTDFAGHFIDDALFVYGMANNGVVNIFNCHFEDVSNMLSIDNKTNTSWTINIINCTVDKWETGEYGGLICLQDTTSETVEEADTENRFHNITINIQNLTLPDGSKLLPPQNIADICGTQDANQIIYMWDELRNHTPYDVSKYPTITIS